MVELIETFSLWYFLPFKKNFCTSINVFTSFAKKSFNDEKKNRKSYCYEKKNWEDSLKVCTLILTSLQNVKIFGRREKIQFCFCKSSPFGSILQSISFHSVTIAPNASIKFLIEKTKRRNNFISFGNPKYFKILKQSNISLFLWA